MTFPYLYRGLSSVCRGLSAFMLLMTHGLWVQAARSQFYKLLSTCTNTTDRNHTHIYVSRTDTASDRPQSRL